MTFSKKILPALTACFIFFIALEVGLNLIAPIYRKINFIAPDPGKYTVLVLGESTSTDLATQNLRSWVKQLKEMLPTVNGAEPQFEIVNLSEPGITTTILLSKLTDYLKSGHPQLVISMMGINDSPHIWYRQLSLIQNENRPFQLKTIRLLKVLLSYQRLESAQKTVSESPEIQKPAKPQLDYPDIDKLLKKLQLTKQGSAAYNEILQGIDEYLSLKPDNQKAQFLGYLAFRLSPADDRLEGYAKSYELLKKSVSFNASEGRRLELSLSLAMRMKRKSDCKFLVQQAMKQGARISPTSLSRLAVCNPEDKEFINAVLEKDNPAFIFDESGRIPTSENYKSIFNLLTSRNICWIAMSYPNRDLRNAILQLNELPESGTKFFTIENKKAFTEAQNAEGYDGLFMDRFAGDFGHLTEKGANIIAQNVLNKIQQLKDGHLCGL
ncbi:MAG: hypothetical protein K0R29_949 [Pseudobdellovibrio sp.]|jgi:lysophospholipase L1-like esterase|nr:hypothetical protein [Pseudobdellovibrio sp.]